MDNRITLTTDEVRHRAGLFTIGETARIVGLRDRRFRYLIEAGRVFGPKTQISCRRRPYYTQNDLRRLRRLVNEE